MPNFAGQGGKNQLKRKRGKPGEADRPSELSQDNPIEDQNTGENATSIARSYSGLVGA